MDHLSHQGMCEQCKEHKKPVKCSLFDWIKCKDKGEMTDMTVGLFRAGIIVEKQLFQRKPCFRFIFALLQTGKTGTLQCITLSYFACSLDLVWQNDAIVE